MKKMMTLAAVALMVAGITAFAGEKGECTKKSDKTACATEKKAEECAAKKAEGCDAKKAECTKDA